MPLIASTYLVRTQDQIGEGGKGEGGGGLPIEMYEKTDAVRVKGEFIFIHCGSLNSVSIQLQSAAYRISYARLILVILCST